jgi:hypothetical protein
MIPEPPGGLESEGSDSHQEKRQRLPGLSDEQRGGEDRQDRDVADEPRPGEEADHPDPGDEALSGDHEKE